MLTTQTQVLGSAAQDAHLRELLPEDAQRLLLQRAGLLQPDEALADVSTAQQEHALALAEELGRLPLALDQAGAYLADVGCGLKGYLELYRSQHTELLRLRGNLETDQHKAVATTWTLAFRQLEQATPAAIELLRLCAFLHPEAIPEDLFSDGAEDLPPALQEVIGNGLKWNQVLADLRRFSLIEREGEAQTLSVHRLVQAVLRDELPASEQRAWAERAVRLVSRAFPEVKFETWGSCQRLLPHALVCADHLDHWQMTFAEAARLLDHAGRYLHERARYKEALPLLEGGLAMREALLGPDDLDVATSLNSLGELFYRQGQYPQTLPLFQRALTIREQVLGVENPDTAYSMNNLGLLYYKQGQYAEALPFLQQALAIREQVLEPTHPEVATGLDNLAGLYRFQHQYAEALPLLQRSLAIREQTLGLTHPDVATGLNNLAGLYLEQSQYTEALPLYQRGLTIREQTLGLTHPDVASSLNNLGLLYQEQEQYAKALAFLQRALVIREQALGLTHPDVAYTLEALGGLYQNQGPKQYVRALPRYQRAVAIMEQALPDHPDTATCLMNLASLLRSMGRPNQARPLEARAKAIRARQGVAS